jgi:hypothetical protein
VEQSPLGSDPAISKDHSESGGTTKETFARYLSRLATKQYDGTITPDCPLDLVLNCHTVHRSPEIKHHAASLGIRLWFIPAGHTDELQPLDRAVFGTLRAKFRRRFQLECRQHPHHRLSKSGSIEILRQIWERLGGDAISRGWHIYVDDFGPDQHLDDDAEWEA